LFEYELPAAVGGGEYETRVVPCGVDEVLCIVRDISERKRMERSLREAEARQQAILNGTTDAIFLKDTAGRYLLINPAVAATFGRPADEIIGKTDQEIWPSEIAEQLMSTDRLVVARRASIETEDCLPVAGRQLTFLSVKAPYVTADDVVQGVIGVSRDITQRKRQEQIKDDFLALASHELKTPLAALLGYIHLLERWSERQGFGPRVDQALVAMRNEGRRLDRLINDLLDVSRIQTGRLPIHLRRMELRPYLEHTIAALRLAIPDHPIVVSLPDAGVACSIDPQRFEQVLANLLTNAAKYSYQAASIYVGCVPHTDHVEITVRDTGLGIPAEDLPFIFDRFYQVLRPPRESRPGMGLGLFITLEIVRQHGGTLTVESREQSGSRFTVRLPYQISSAQEVSADATDSSIPTA
jgi:PAS domain S-box-containing protein